MSVRDESQGMFQGQFYCIVTSVEKPVKLAFYETLSCFFKNYCKSLLHTQHTDSVLPPVNCTVAIYALLAYYLVEEHALVKVHREAARCSL